MEFDDREEDNVFFDWMLVFDWKKYNTKYTFRNHNFISSDIHVADNNY